MHRWNASGHKSHMHVWRTSRYNSFSCQVGWSMRCHTNTIKLLVCSCCDSQQNYCNIEFKRVYHSTCFTDVLYSSMVPGVVPSQLELLSMGQTYFDTLGTCSNAQKTSCCSVAVVYYAIRDALLSQSSLETFLLHCYSVFYQALHGCLRSWSWF